MSTAKHVQLNTRCFSLLLYVSPSICITLYISPIYISPYISYLQARFDDVIVSHGGQTQCPCLQLQLHSLAQYGADDKGLTGPVFHNLYASCINVSLCCMHHRHCSGRPRSKDLSQPQHLLMGLIQYLQRCMSVLAGSDDVVRSKAVSKSPHLRTLQQRPPGQLPPRWREAFRANDPAAMQAPLPRALYQGLDDGWQEGHVPSMYGEDRSEGPVRGPAMGGEESAVERDAGFCPVYGCVGSHHCDVVEFVLAFTASRPTGGRRNKGCSPYTWSAHVGAADATSATCTISPARGDSSRIDLRDSGMDFPGPCKKLCLKTNTICHCLQLDTWCNGSHDGRNWPCHGTKGGRTSDERPMQ